MKYSTEVNKLLKLTQLFYSTSDLEFDKEQIKDSQHVNGINENGAQSNR